MTQKSKLDTTGLTGKDRILMLAEIVKAAEQGRELQFCAFPRPSRMGTIHDVWHPVSPIGSTYTEKLNWRIKPIIKTYYVNLYPSGTRRPFQSYTQSTSSQDAHDRARIEGGAIAVAVPITVEE